MKTLWKIISNKFILFVLLASTVLFVYSSRGSYLVNIEAGQRGVIFDQIRGGVQDTLLSEGLHFKMPVFQSVIQLPIRTQKIVFFDRHNQSLSYSASNKQLNRSQRIYKKAASKPRVLKNMADTLRLAPKTKKKQDAQSVTSSRDEDNLYGQMQASSADLQDVFVDAMVIYHLQEQQVSKIYREVGLDYESKKVVPSTIDAVKAEIGKYKVSDLLTQRNEIKQKIVSELRQVLAKEGIVLEDISLTNFDFDQQFKNEIEQKQIEEQKAQKEQYILQQKEVRLKAKVIQAEAEKKAKILEGEGIAAYNQLVRSNMTPEVLAYKKLENSKVAIDKWNGQYPATYFGGDNASIPLINLQPKN